MGGTKPSPEKIIKYLDANDDGKLSKEESANARNGKLEENFGRIDVNNDGFIELEEFKSLAKSRKEMKGSRKNHNHEKIFTMLDTNSDGRISKEEASKTKKRKVRRKL